MDTDDNADDNNDENEYDDDNEYCAVMLKPMMKMKL